MEISVVVPVRNEESSIRNLLEGLLSQTLRPNEIVITDGGSNDETTKIIEQFVRDGAPVRLIREQQALPGRGRNLGAERANNQWIAFTDAGNKPAPQWLAALAQRVDDNPSVDVVFGSYEPVIDSFFKECAAIAYVPPPFETEEGTWIRPRSIASSLMRRKVWEAVGGFRETLRSGEDLLFMRNIERRNFHIVRAPKAVVHWEIQPNLWRTFRRFVTYARNNIRAGLWREWQAAVLLRYGLIGLTIAPAVFFGWRYLALPLLLWLLMLVARAGRALRRNRHAYPATHARNLARLFLLVPIIAALDVAALLGSLNWLLLDKFSFGTSRNEYATSR